MRAFKHILSLCFAALVALSLTTTATAVNLAGDEVVYCNATILIADLTGGYAGEQIKVTFTDVTGTSIKDIELVPANWLAQRELKLSLPAPTTYNITFEGVEDGYKIVDTFDATSIETKFAASEGTKSFYWSIVFDAQNESGMNLVSKENAATSTNREHVSVTDEKAEKVYREFLEAVSFIETDASWYNGIAATLNQYGKDSINRNTYSQWYADYVQGGSVEEYFAMTPFEQFLWTETYTKLAFAVNSGWGFDHYFADKAAFESSITNLATNMMNGNNNETVKAAYLKLMDWQFDYISKNGVPFNFINNRNYIEEMAEPSASAGETDPVVSGETEETQQPTEAIPEPTEEVGVWDDVGISLAENAISIIVLVVLGGATFLVVRYRKSKNYDDEDE